ncbi:MAG: hypothetical protein CVU64_07750 [Deltaproteobacteria bacterium HGW-Deltaproteobacteria-21]|nr:MAG: hypothetical protein CVU64_07750 [Deltaproteobacteria bacterium HGW-Deltaproteobacteria-21]
MRQRKKRNKNNKSPVFNGTRVGMKFASGILQVQVSEDDPRPGAELKKRSARAMGFRLFSACSHSAHMNDSTDGLSPT